MDSPQEVTRDGRPARRVPAAARLPGPPRPGRRPVAVPALAELHGPKEGILTVPRRLYWSGGTQCGTVALRDEDQVALAYEAIIDAARTPADLADHLDAELLARVWPTLGVSRPRRQAWETRNPELAASAARSHAA